MITLRAFECADAHQYFKIANDKRCYFPFSFCENLNDAEYVIDTFIYSTDLDSYAIVNEENNIVGAIYAERCRKSDTMQVSYFIGSKYHKKGYATQAVRKMEEILKNKQIHIMEFAIDPENIASIKTATKCGAVLAKSSSFNYYQKNIN